MLCWTRSILAYSLQHLCYPNLVAADWVEASGIAFSDDRKRAELEIVRRLWDAGRPMPSVEKLLDIYFLPGVLDPSEMNANFNACVREGCIERHAISQLSGIVTDVSAELKREVRQLRRYRGYTPGALKEDVGAQLPRSTYFRRRSAAEPRVSAVTVAALYAQPRLASDPSSAPFGQSFLDKMSVVLA
eukprot:gene21282-25574_t